MSLSELSLCPEGCLSPVCQLDCPEAVETSQNQQVWPALKQQTGEGLSIPGVLTPRGSGMVPGAL